MFCIIYKDKDETSSGLIKQQSYSYYSAGEIFEPSNFQHNDIYDILTNKQNFPKLLGEFSYILNDEQNIYVINDEIGTIEWYYYNQDNTFIVSNNYWEIVNFIQPSIEDINKEAIYEQILMVNTLDNATFIKNIKIIPPASILQFNKNTQHLSIKQYCDISYNEDTTLTKEKTFNTIEKLFTKMISKITKYNPNSKIAITISGGLDSRFPLPFLKQCNTVFSYLIGQSNNIFTKPFDFKNAQKMANMYNLKFKMIDPFDINIQEKILIDILRNPTKDSDILKSLDYNKLFSKNQFDILITGAYGGLIGGRVLNNNLLNNSDSTEFAYQLFYDYSLYREINQGKAQRTWLEKKYRKILWYLNKIFHTTYFLEMPSRLEYVNRFLYDDFLFNQKYKIQIIKKLEQYINNEKMKQKNNLSIVMKYHLRRHSILGSFESLQGQVKSYSIYHPYIYDFSKSWPIKYLQNRTIMEEYLLTKHKELATIPLQSKQLSIVHRYNQNINIIKKTLLTYKNKFLLKFNGLTINYTKWFFQDTVQKEVYKTFYNNNKFFYTIFNEKDVKHLLKYKKYTHFIENLWKMKILIDLIETNQYTALINKDIYKITTKY